LTDKFFYLGNRHFPVSHGLKIGMTPNGTVILGKITDGMLKLFDGNEQKEIPCQLAASSIMSYQGQLYIKNGDKLLEIDFMEVGAKVLVSGKTIANVLDNASHMFDGVVVQSLLGAYYLSMFPMPGVHRQLHINELDEYRVVDAKFNSNVLMTICVKDGIYDRFVFRFSEDWQSYDIRKVEDITPEGLNFVTLDNGVCVHLTEDEDLELFSSRKDSANLKQMSDRVLGGDMRLFAMGSTLMFARDNCVYSMTMRTK